MADDSSNHESYEAFERRMRAYEEGPFTTDFDRLLKAGIDLPEPAALNDHALSAKLRQVIVGLANFRVFINGTDHLSDRDLYSRLWNDSLREEIPEGAENDGGNFHVDLSIGETEDVFLRYYADQETRSKWLEDFPDCPMPPHEELPFDRDRHLPQPSYPETAKPPFPHPKGD